MQTAPLFSCAANLEVAHPRRGAHIRADAMADQRVIRTGLAENRSCFREIDIIFLPRLAERSQGAVIDVRA